MVIIIHCARSRRTRSVTSGEVRTSLSRRRDSRLRNGFVMLPVEVYLISCHMASEGLSFVESGKADFSLLLSGLTICFCFDSIQTHLLRIILVWTSTLRTNSWTASETTSTKCIEATAEEQKDPSSECEPYSVSNLSVTYGVNSRFCNEKEDYIEDKGDEGDNSCKT